MKRSSNHQLSLDVNTFQDVDSATLAPSDARDGHRVLKADPPEWPVLEFKGIGVESAARAASARTAGRINASKISDLEHRSFVDERHRLLTKKYETGLTRQEENRLTYVDWSLDRIEDAKHGFHLDLVEAKIQMYESLAQNILALRADLERYAPARRKR